MANCPNILLFLGRLWLSVVSSIVLAKRLEQWAAWLRMSPRMRRLSFE